MFSQAFSKSLLPLQRGEKVADRPDEGANRRFFRLEILNGAAQGDVKYHHTARTPFLWVTVCIDRPLPRDLHDA